MNCTFCSVESHTKICCFQACKQCAQVYNDEIIKCFMCKKQLKLFTFSFGMETFFSASDKQIILKKIIDKIKIFARLPVTRNFGGTCGFDGTMTFYIPRDGSFEDSRDAIIQENKNLSREINNLIDLAPKPKS